MFVPILVLVGCGAEPVRPVPECQAAAVLAAPPQEMLATEPAPAVPDPDSATQAAVARYLLDLHAWGTACQLRQTAARAWVGKYLEPAEDAE